MNMTKISNFYHWIKFITIHIINCHQIGMRTKYRMFPIVIYLPPIRFAPRQILQLRAALGILCFIQEEYKMFSKH